MRLDVTQYTHFIWDWNGTILNDTWLTLEIFNKVIVDLGHEPLCSDRYRKLFRHPIIEMYFELGVIDSVEHFKKLSDDFHIWYDERSRDCKLHEGVLACIQHLSERGQTQSILSALPEVLLHEIVAHHQLTSHFTAILGHPSTLGDSKIEYGRAWMQEQHFKPSETLMIGDTLHDIEVAEALGIDCLILPNGYQHESMFNPDSVYLLDDYQAFYAILTENSTALDLTRKRCEPIVA